MDSATAAAENINDLVSMLREADGQTPNHNLCGRAAETIAYLQNLVRNDFDSARVLEWMWKPDRKRANESFTAGGERQAAYLIEMAEYPLQQLIRDLARQVQAEKSDHSDFLAFMAGHLADFKCCHEPGEHTGTPPMFWPELIRCIIAKHVQDAKAEQQAELAAVLQMLDESQMCECGKQDCMIPKSRKMDIVRDRLRKLIQPPTLGASE